MTTISSILTIHMLCSLDGYVTKKDGSVDWMNTGSQYPKGEELTENEIQEFLESVDCYVMGSRTYEHALELGWPYGETPVYVFSNGNLQDERAQVKFLSGDVKEVVEKGIKSVHKNIWMVGGPDLVSQFFYAGLADELVITYVPVLLGEGLPFFSKIAADIRLETLGTRAFKDGMVEIRYRVLK